MFKFVSQWVLCSFIVFAAMNSVGCGNKPEADGDKMKDGKMEEKK